MTSFREVEILVPVLQDKASALRALQKFGEPNVRHIKDMYYTHSGIPVLAGDAAGKSVGSLRIRDENGRFTLTAKRDHVSGSTWLFSDEYTVALPNSTEIKALLQALDFEERVFITTTRYAYLHEAYEIVLDDVSELGLMLEVEAVSAGNNPLETKPQVRDFLRSLPLQLGPELIEGKYELALRQKLQKA